jgi:hypothetical protein
LLGLVHVWKQIRLPMLPVSETIGAEWLMRV